jgi:hypothetical protein
MALKTLDTNLRVIVITEIGGLVSLAYESIVIRANTVSTHDITYFSGSLFFSFILTL